MKRVTKRVRKVRSAGAREHLVFTSKKHAEDKAAADRLREPTYVRLPDVPTVPGEPFPRAAEFASQFGLQPKAEGGLKAVYMSPDAYTDHLAVARRDAGVWYTPSKRRKKNGEVQLQKRTGEGLSDCYFSFPVWVSTYLAQLVELGGFERARKIALLAVSRAAMELQKRTNYKVVGYTIHPDSKGVLGYHVQYQTAADGKLLGRSADGAKGRKGLRLVGDAMSAVARMGEYVSVLDKFNVLASDRDFDDLAINKVLDAKLREQLAPEWSVIEAAARTYSEDWRKRQAAALAGPAEVAALKARIEELEADIEYLLVSHATALTDEQMDGAAKIRAERAQSVTLRAELTAALARVTALEGVIALQTKDRAGGEPCL